MPFKTDLGFYLISDEEYYALPHWEEDLVYVLVNKEDNYFIVLKNGMFMGKIDRGLKEMKFTAKAMDTGDQGKDMQEEAVSVFKGLSAVTGKKISPAVVQRALFANRK